MATGKSSPEHQRASAERAAQARARIQQAQRRRQFQIVGAVVGAVVVILAALVVVKIATDDGPTSGAKASTAPTSVAAAVANVPASAFDSAGLSSVTAGPKAIGGTTLTADGKPEVLYIGAEFCPYCAAARWPLAVALARFGTFTNLGQTESAGSPEPYPRTQTLTFHGATYTSKYLALVAKEIKTNQVVDGDYTPLDTLTSDQSSLYGKYGNGIPFIYLGTYLLGVTYDPAVLQGKTHEQIAAALSDPGSAIGKAIDGSANVYTAALCRLTTQQPANVCTSSGVTAAAKATGLSQ